ncbi:MAG: membrane protein insertase YidC, partial [Desulfocapsaceae bacterium]|nr:membrane protein insertase YidC [Desulfocapsaceae bacterium]
MDNYRAFLAIVISFVILIVYQYFFAGFAPKKAPEDTTQGTRVEQAGPRLADKSETPQGGNLPSTAISRPRPADHNARQIVVDTDLYTAVFSEQGGTLQNFVLKQYKETDAPDSKGKQLIITDDKEGFPLDFTWGGAVERGILFKSQAQDVKFKDGDKKEQLVLLGHADSGVEVERKYVFDRDQYLIDLEIKVKNTTAQPLQGAPQLYQVNVPFEDHPTGSNYLFTGPAAFVNSQLQEYKSKELSEGPKTVHGVYDWAAYEGTYFMAGILPGQNAGESLTMQQNGHVVEMVMTGKLETLPPGGELVYSYRLYYGPKKLSLLKDIGYNLDKSVNFGWFDVIAKPTLWLLNFFYGFVKNYGIAIIMVTVLFKLAFWPITQKGMKSMKNMQKLQPKMVKIKEKYKDDPAQMNKEVMNLYKTYKVNPLGGCLPMVLQIPVFFALYKVLLQCIELRHAPFMLWITDLSAPDRLWPWL